MVRKRLRDFSLQDTVHVFRKGKGILIFLKEKRKGKERVCGGELSYHRVKAKGVKRSINITKDLRQDRCAQGVWFPYGKVLPDR